MSSKKRKKTEAMNAGDQVDPEMGPAELAHRVFYHATQINLFPFILSMPITVHGRAAVITSRDTHLASGKQRFLFSLFLFAFCRSLGIFKGCGIKTRRRGKK